jgi:hypothetical protein
MYGYRYRRGARRHRTSSAEDLIGGGPRRRLGSYLRDAFHEGGADVVACLPIPRA